MKPMGKPLPLPLRVAAGLAASAAEGAKAAPRRLVELPVTVASQAMQASMRVQQEITELAIKGDDALSVFHPAEESPEWATFDEDVPAATWHSARPAVSAWDAAGAAEDDVVRSDDPWRAEERALAMGLPEGEFDTHEVRTPQTVLGRGDDSAARDRGTEPPAACPEYPGLSLPQLRARLRRFSVADLRELLDFERAHRDRPDYTGMLSRRIDTVREQG